MSSPKDKHYAYKVVVESDRAPTVFLSRDEAAHWIAEWIKQPLPANVEPHKPPAVGV